MCYMMGYNDLYLNLASGYLNIAVSLFKIDWDHVFERGGVVIGYLVPTLTDQILVDIAVTVMSRVYNEQVCLTSNTRINTVYKFT